MTAPSAFLAELSSLLDRMEAALLAQDTDAVLQLSTQLQHALQHPSPWPPDNSPQGLSTTDHLLAQGIEQRLAQLRSTLIQQGAAAERALATLFPDRGVGAYADKSGYGPAGRGANRRSYLA